VSKNHGGWVSPYFLDTVPIAILYGRLLRAAGARFRFYPLSPNGVAAEKERTPAVVPGRTNAHSPGQANYARNSDAQHFGTGCFSEGKKILDEERLLGLLLVRFCRIGRVVR